MAELYIARQEAMGGFEKAVVLKVLQPRYARNPRVVTMFLDEARLAAKLNHATIVHVYDVADDGGMKYIAMEYIHGETVADIVKRGLAQGNYLPMEHAVHIAAETAAGWPTRTSGASPTVTSGGSFTATFRRRTSWSPMKARRSSSISASRERRTSCARKRGVLPGRRLTCPRNRCEGRGRPPFGHLLPGHHPL